VNGQLKCEDCELRYNVVWDNDGGECPVVYCPRCGSDNIEEQTGNGGEESEFE
jgi:hypothetical protein